MSTALMILLAALVIAAGASFAYLKKRHTANLRRQFGPEYDRAIHEFGDRSLAEKALEDRSERAETYEIRTLTDAERRRFSEEWRDAQAHFVDDPQLSIGEADRLVTDVMRLRGYPMADFDRRAEDLSVAYPHVIRKYRAAHAIALSDEEGQATTEDLRKAMVYYRELFDDLLELQAAGLPGVSRSM